MAGLFGRGECFGLCVFLYHCFASPISILCRVVYVCVCVSICDPVFPKLARSGFCLSGV